VGLRERGRGQLVPPEATLPALADEAGLAKDTQVLGDCGAAGAEVTGELADRAPSGPEPIEERPAGGIGNGTEDVGVCAGSMHE
jgi:hypothetical protein